MNLDFQQILTQIVGFLILLWLLRRYAWGPLLLLMDTRRSDIVSQFGAIQKGNEEIAGLKQMYAEKIADIENQAKLKIQDAVIQGERQAKQIAEEARLAAQGILEKAREDIQQEVAAARIMLRNEVALLAVSAAEQVIRKELDTEQDRTLVLQYLDEIKGFK